MELLKQIFEFYQYFDRGIRKATYAHYTSESLHKKIPRTLTHLISAGQSSESNENRGADCTIRTSGIEAHSGQDSWPSDKD